MSVFDFATVAISFILGLAVTCLLESIVQAFRARRTCRLHWLPFVWVACVLVLQFQFWWALYELKAMPSLSIGVFSLLLFLSTLLFLAGALVLPNGEAEYPTDLATYFTTDGSWGAGALALYGLTAALCNVLIFGLPLADPINLLNLALGVVALVVAFTTGYAWQVALTLLYAAGLLLVTAMASSSVYTNTAA